jgi:uncharacterized membrane protein YbhN (UPF0104 family)
LQTTPPPTPARGDAAPVWPRRARTLATLLVLAALTAIGVRHAGDLDRLATADPLRVGLMAACLLLQRVLHSELVRRTLAELGHRLASFEVFALTMLSALGNLVVPRSGFGALGVSLRARHGVPFSTSGSLLLPLALLDLLVVSGAGLLIQLAAFGLARPRAPLVAATFAGSLLACLAISWLPLPARLPFAPPRVRQFLEELGSAWTQLRRSRSFVWRACAVLAAMSALRALRLSLAFGALGLSPDFAGVAIASLLGDVMFLFALTPAALGLREAAIVYCAGLAGVTPAASLAAAVLDRLVITAVVLAAAQVSAWRLLRRPAR